GPPVAWRFSARKTTMDSISSFSVMASLLTTAMMRSETSSSLSVAGRWRMSPGLGVSITFGLGVLTATVSGGAFVVPSHGTQRGRLHGRGRRERDHRRALAGLDALDAQRARRDADAHDVDELLGGPGQRTEAIGQLGANLGELALAGHAGQPLVERQSLIDLG